MGDCTRVGGLDRPLRRDRLSPRHAHQGDSRRKSVWHLTGGVLRPPCIVARFLVLGLARYDARRLQVVREANSIGTTFLRTQLLNANTARLMREYLRQYVDARIAFAAAGVNEGVKADAAHRSGALQKEMWNLVMAQDARDKRSTMVPLFIAALNDTIDESAEEEDVFAAHIPDPVVIVLAIVIGFASVLLGIGFGRTDHRGGSSIAFFAITLALVVGMILDLDRLQRGFIRVSLAPLQTLRQSLVEPSPPRMSP